jgi:pilus assembly protein Flp/PilA
VKVFLSERGQGLVEYALILLFVAIVVIIAVTAIGTTTKSMFSDVNSSITTMISQLI